MSDLDAGGLARRIEERVLESRRWLEQARSASGTLSAAASAEAAAHAELADKRLARIETAAARAAEAATHNRRTEERLALIEAVMHDGLARVEAAVARVDAAVRDALARVETVAQDLARVEAVVADVALRQASYHPNVYGGRSINATLIDGLLVGVPAEEQRLALYHTFYGFQEPGVVSVFTGLLTAGSVVVDVGACIGMFTLYAARAVGLTGKVYAFEPAPRTHGVLVENLKFNGFYDTGVVDARPVAVSDRNGTAVINEYDGDFGWNTLFALPGTAARQTSVETVRLDDALAGVERVDVVKIDAEGAERAVIAGMPKLLAANPALAIVMEFSPSHLQRANVDAHAFGEELLALGFGMRLIDDITGELQPVDVPALLARPNSNVLLQRTARAS